MLVRLIKLLFLFGIILTNSNCSTGTSGETVLGRAGKVVLCGLKQLLGLQRWSIFNQYVLVTVINLVPMLLLIV